MILYGANLPSWISYLCAMLWGNTIFPFSVVFMVFKIGYAAYDDIAFHWKRAIPSEIVVHYLLFFSVLALDVIMLRWAYVDGFSGLWSLFGA